MKKCPFCAEVIQDEAIFCRYCKSNLNTYPVNGEKVEIGNNNPVIQEKNIKNEKKESYFKYFLIGALFGVGISFYGANSIADNIGHGFSNSYIWLNRFWFMCNQK